MELSVFDIIGDGVSNEEIASSISEKLKNKYNEEFGVKMLGNRYGTASDDYVLAYCFPKSCENLLFTSMLSKDESILEDDYYLKKISYKLQSDFEANFKKEELDVVSKIKIIGINKLENNVTIEQFIEANKNYNFLAKFICTKEIDEEILKNIYSNIENEYKSINLKSVVFSMSENDFNQFKSLSEKIPDVTESIIEKYNAKQEKIIKISDGNVIIIK